eukprot:scaffold368_cov258-Pinguiococcus_pyrenoidosus.AAC.8
MRLSSDRASREALSPGALDASWECCGPRLAFAPPARGGRAARASQGERLPRPFGEPCEATRLPWQCLRGARDSSLGSPAAAWRHRPSCADRLPLPARPAPRLLHSP